MSMLERLARWSYTHRWRILAIWIVALVGSVFLANVARGDYASNFSLPGSEAQQALDLLQNATFEPPGGAEAVGFVAAIILLLITFGSVLAMGLPILSALFGIGIGISLVFLFANWVSVPNFTPQIASMIGIGVGIDY